MSKFYFFLCFTALLATAVNGQNQETTSEQKISWYDKVKIGGYLQMRYNDLYKTNPDMENPQGDKTYGGYKGFSIRRMRVKLSGQIHPRMYFYFQADFASDGINMGQLRDAYFDYFLDPAGVFRLRGGQSKIPFGFENLQSSQNRLALDRNDPLNSSHKDERDLNVSLMWTPKEIKDRFNSLKKSGLKGSGDYGALNLMVYNGQKANELIPNVEKPQHVALRATWPFQLESGQFIETSIQAYTGQYVTTNVAEGVNVRDDDGRVTETSALLHKWNDQRIGASVIYYPQPFGFQAEYNFGYGPEYDPATNSIGKESLSGGYMQVMYQTKIKEHTLFPFIRFMRYNGGKKFEQDARSYDMKELEFGLEWQPHKNFELVSIYTLADRRYEDSEKPDNRQKGQLIRFQLQVNF